MHPPKMLTVTVDSVTDGHSIPERFTRCGPRGSDAVHDNIRPAVRWLGGPGGIRSYAVMIVDRDVPANLDAANKPGMIIPADAPRRSFYHWLQADIPPAVNHLEEGRAGRASPGISGRNDFGARGTHGGIGYDGPCPPWNDERLHHYHFIVYALDVPTLGLPEGFSGQQMEDALHGHILARGEVIATYSTNSNRRRAA